MQDEANGPASATLGQGWFVVLGITVEWGLPPSAAPEIAQLLTDVCVKANFSTDIQRGHYGDTQETSFEAFAHVVDGGPLAGTWRLSCAEELGGYSARWERDWTWADPGAEAYVEPDGGPGLAVLRCDHSDRVLYLGFDARTEASPNVGAVLAGWIWIGPTAESARDALFKGSLWHTACATGETPACVSPWHLHVRQSYDRITCTLNASINTPSTTTTRKPGQMSAQTRSRSTSERSVSIT